jgi:predicted peptidase
MKPLLLAATTMATALAEPLPMTFKAEGGTEVLYRFAAPEKTEAGKLYPLVLFLHGAGERGADNKAQLKHGVNDILKGAAALGESVYLIAPQCPPERWWSEPTPDKLTLKDAGGDNPLLEAVLALVEETALKNPIDRKRIYITGISMGGFGTWDMLARSPQTWAAAIPICGGGDKKTAPSIKHIPIRIHHGAADNVVPPEASNIMAIALGNIGGKATIREYPGVGHDSWTQTYKDPEVIKWLFAQKKPD